MSYHGMIPALLNRIVTGPQISLRVKQEQMIAL
jgi:hypothetical protein